MATRNKFSSQRTAWIKAISATTIDFEFLGMLVEKIASTLNLDLIDVADDNEENAHLVHQI